MSGISKAKGRRNSKSKRSPTFRKFPAKAGKRKVYTAGKPKTKTFPDGTGGYIMAQRNFNALPPAHVLRAEVERAGM